jgi:apolipoprotein N-acyltransferase
MSKQQEHTRRDSETQMLLGGFIFVLGLPVLIGTWWAETTAARVVNVAAALALLAIGAGFFLYGRSLLKRLD